MPITYGSVCSGIESATVAWRPLGWRAQWLAEIEPFPSAVLAHHYPATPNHGDMTKLARQVLAGSIAAPEVLVGGTPCFTAGHLVLTDKGYVPIEQIKPGDMVMTHLGRLQQVVRIGSKSAEVGVLKAVGLRESVRVTADHPFLAVDWRMQNTRRDGRYERVEYCGKPEWVEARNMPGLQWCALTNYQQIEKSPVSRKFGVLQAMYVAGMYLGDGHIRRWSQSDKKALVLSLNPEKLVRLSAVVGEGSYSVSQERTSARVTICDTALCDWLLEQFGELSHLKRIPAWVLGHEHRAALLQGYLDTDGCKLKAGVGITTTSRALAYGATDLLNAEGYAASVALIETAGTCVIEGRVVNQRDWYQVRAFHRPLSRKSRVRHDYLLRAVQSFEPAGVDTVFNIEVEGDNSYVVNGAVVHNCQAFSVAGMRGGLDDPRGQLTIKYVELADAVDHVRPAGDECIVVWENVPGVLSDKGNAFGCFLGALVGESDALQPSGGKWTDAGCVYGPRRAAAWRVLDAQYFGLAQRRRRVFVVSSARAGFDPAAVLFESEGVRRDTAPRRGEGENPTGTIAGGARRNCGYSTDDIPLTAGSLRAQAQSSHREDSETFIPVAFGGGANCQQTDVATALSAHPGGTRMDAETETFIVAGTLQANGKAAGSATQQDAESGLLVVHGTQDPCVDDHIAHTLGRNHGQENAIFAIQNATRGKDQNGLGIAADSPMYTLDQASQHAVFAIQAGALRTNPASGPDGVGVQADHAYTLEARAEVQAVAAASAVRRLTPRECERLQGFSPIREEIKIAVCIDSQKHVANADLSCRKWQSNASPVGDHELPQSASAAETDLITCQAGRAPLVVVTVRTNSAGSHLEIHSRGKLAWSASTADVSSRSHPSTQNAAIAAEIAQAARDLALEIRTGKAESLRSISLSTQAKNGATSALKSGVEREASASDAVIGANLAKFTTSALGLLIPISGSTVATSLCSVLAAISGCIPSETLPERFSLLLELESPYTLIPWRGKPAEECPDGPRYKAIGNSKAVPVVRWIGRRIQRELERAQ